MKESVSVFYNITAISSGPEKYELEERMKKEISELKRVQDALTKAIKRNRVTEIDEMETPV